MPLDVHILSGSGEHILSNVVDSSNYPSGLVSYVTPLLQTRAGTLVFTNAINGTSMNADASAGGTPEIIHNGGDTSAWDTTAVSGTWDFADTTNPQAGSACVSLTSGLNGQSAVFEDSSAGTIDMSSYVSISGQVRLETFDPSRHTITLHFGLAGVTIGDTVLLSDNIDTGLLNSYQAFQLSKSLFGLTSQTIDEFTITVTRSGGSKPTFRLDALQIENTGGSLIYEAVPNSGTVFRPRSLELVIADNIDSIVTGSSTTYPTLEGLSYNAMLGVSNLSNGIVVNCVINNVTKLSSTLSNIGDFLLDGFTITDAMSDGTNTFIKLVRFFEKNSVKLKSPTDDLMRFIVNDDLSGLLIFKATLHGEEEVIVDRLK
jgi:hypothetical protein